MYMCVYIYIYTYTRTHTYIKNNITTLQVQHPPRAGAPALGIARYLDFLMIITIQYLYILSPSLYEL